MFFDPDRSSPLPQFSVVVPCDMGTAERIAQQRFSSCRRIERWTGIPMQLLLVSLQDTAQREGVVPSKAS